MSTQPPGKRPDIKRVTVGAAEIPFSFDGVVSVVNFIVQAVGDVAVRVGLTVGSTASADNYWTLKSGATLRFDDVNYTPDTDGLYFLSEGAETVVEVFYWG